MRSVVNGAEQHRLKFALARLAASTSSCPVTVLVVHTSPATFTIARMRCYAALTMQGPRARPR